MPDAYGYTPTLLDKALDAAIARDEPMPAADLEALGTPRVFHAFRVAAAKRGLPDPVPGGETLEVEGITALVLRGDEGILELDCAGCGGPLIDCDRGPLVDAATDSPHECPGPCPECVAGSNDLSGRHRVGCTFRLEVRA